VERDESTNDRSTRKRLQTGNVIRLPQGWFGPVDQLVPFGPSATGAPNTPAPPATDITSPGPTPDPFTPPSAQSFWTADSAALQAPLQAPKPTAPPPSVAVPTPAGQIASNPVARHERRSRRPGKRTAGATIAGLILIAVVVVSSLGTRSSRPPTVRVQAAALTATITAPVTIERAVMGITAAVQKPVNAATAHARTVADAQYTAEQVERARAIRARRRGRIREHAARGADASAPVVPASSTVAASSPPTNITPTSVSAAPVTTGGPSSSTSSSSSASSQPAFGQNGSLGPGSSPASR
jgi:hypothetical protein